MGIRIHNRLQISIIRGNSRINDYKAICLLGNIRQNDTSEDNDEELRLRKSREVYNSQSCGADVFTWRAQAAYTCFHLSAMKTSTERAW